MSTGLCFCALSPFPPCLLAFVFEVQWLFIREGGVTVALLIHIISYLVFDANVSFHTFLFLCFRELMVGL